MGVDANRDYVDSANKAVARCEDGRDIQIVHADFFEFKWKDTLDKLPEPLLIIGNPPWITNAGMSRLKGENLPIKSNTAGLRGMEARTGKSNFDISEWMIWRITEIMRDRVAIIAFLCKTSVARKVLVRLWKHDVRISRTAIYRIDAKQSFDVNADACLFVVAFEPDAEPLKTCEVFADLDAAEPTDEIGFQDGLLISHVEPFARWKHLRGREWYKWRSGIKHDCARIMELSEEGDRYRNGVGELLDLEAECVYPLLKGSDVGNGRGAGGRYLLITQRSMNEETSTLDSRYPRVWAYLSSHAEALDGRASVIYRGRPRFCLFGVGEYAFAPWKVAISALYKRIEFRAIGPRKKKPVVFDDTVYYVSCDSESEARLLEKLLNSVAAKEFLSALIFWDAKRPISIDILRQLDIRKLASELGVEDKYLSYVRKPQLEAMLE